MLSPHEFATLMLIKASPDQIDLGRAELDTLFEQQLMSQATATPFSRPSPGYARHPRRPPPDPE